VVEWFDGFGFILVCMLFDVFCVVEWVFGVFDLDLSLYGYGYFVVYGYDVVYYIE